MQIVVVVTVLRILTAHLCKAQSESEFYDACAPSTCGGITISFPFSSSHTFCSLPGYEVSCDRSSSIPTLTLSGIPYTINDINFNYALLTLSDANLASAFASNQCDKFHTHFLPLVDLSPFQLPSWGFNLTFAWCGQGQSLSEGFLQEGCTGNESLYILPGGGQGLVVPKACQLAALPVRRTNILNANLSNRENLIFVVRGGFPLLWENSTSCSDCEAGGGRCGYNRSSSQFRCFCKFGCSGGRPGSERSTWKIIIGVVVPTAAILLLGVIIPSKFRNKALSIFNKAKATSVSRTNSIDVDEFIKNYRSNLTTNYSYTQIKRITNGFKQKLGQGGYGNVFKGKLENGQLVAVKILDKSSNNNGRDFVNEVATIGMIHHVNIIRLLGYCCDGLNRALVYEFMPKGSLGDLVSKEEYRLTVTQQKLLEIAIGIARGIEYLHQGCDKRILHLDIKPHNVLLDSNLHPKISDFGLAKLYSRKESKVPLTRARGTVGFIAPEVFMRNLGGVSHKSDVYSYGMVLLEMIIGRREHEQRDDKKSSEDYFPEWVYEQLNQWRSMVEFEDSVFEEDIGISMKMVMVGLWCIQVNPVDRPSISEAVGMLEGRLEAIETPPKPFLFSPQKQQQIEYYASSMSTASVMSSQEQ